MLIALLADIHANREALTACLAEAKRAGADRYVFLGDLVGYGADPAWVVDRVAEMVEGGAIAVLGNHDAAALHGSEAMNSAARTAIEWTRTRLAPAHRSFLASLPLTVVEGDRLYVHASASAPADWIYVLGAREAFQSFRATHRRLTFCGHTPAPAECSRGRQADSPARPTALARRARRRRSAARPQPGCLLRSLRRDAQQADICTRAL